MSHATKTSRPSRVRVAIYVHGREPHTVERQQHSLNAYLATRPGWRLAARYADLRPRNLGPRRQLRQALTDARAGRFDVLLVYALDRLTRDLHELATILADLDTARVTLCAVGDPVDTSTPAGRLIAGFVAAFAAFDHRTPRSRQARPRGHAIPARERSWRRRSLAAPEPENTP